MVFLKQTVTTPYGDGVVQEVRSVDSRVVIRPITWELANAQKPTFYMNPNDVQPFYKPGTQIKCSFGFGTIQSIRDADGIYVVTLKNWSLADGKSPTLYLNEQSFSKYVEPKVVEKPKNTFKEAHDRSMVAKAQAKEFFQAKKFTEARIKYLETLEIMKTIEEELSNEEKGKFVELSIFCHSNLAVCAFYENDFPETIRFGQSTITLIETIERQDNTNQVWVALQAIGMSSDKLRDQKVKNLRIVAKAEIKRQNFEEAKQLLTTALRVNQNENTAKELNDLLIDVNKKLSVVKKKEKNMWQKAFTSKGGAEEESAEVTTSSSISPTNQSSANGFSPAKNGKAKPFTEEDKSNEQFTKRFQVNTVNNNQTTTAVGKKVTKSTTNSKESKNQEVSKIGAGGGALSFLSNYVLPTSILLGVSFLAISWWQQHARNRR